MSATLADIARATGLSISTVSRVLSEAPAARRIRPDTRARISAAAAEMGYRPNLLARSLRTRKTHTVAVMVSDIANPWFGRMASLMEQSLHRRGYSLIVCNSGEQAALEQDYLRLLPQKGIDGLIIVPIATELAKLFRYLPEQMPIVVVDRPVAGIGASVTTDQHQASALLCDEVARIGANTVALVRGPGHVFTHRIRGEVVKGRFAVVADHEGPAQPETGREAWPAIAAAGPDAIICTNNFLGQGVIEAMAESDCRLPIACFDEIPLMELLGGLPVVTCVQDVSRIAESAVEMLLAQIAGAESPTRQTVPARITANAAFRTLCAART